MPFQNVMPQYQRGTLHSGSKHGPTVTNRKQAIAIMLSEKRSGEGEHMKVVSHMPKGGSLSPKGDLGALREAEGRKAIRRGFKNAGSNKGVSNRFKVRSGKKAR